MAVKICGREYGDRIGFKINIAKNQLCSVDQCWWLVYLPHRWQSNRRSGFATWFVTFLSVLQLNASEKEFIQSVVKCPFSCLVMFIFLRKYYETMFKTLNLHSIRNNWHKIAPLILIYLDCYLCECVCVLLQHLIFKLK